MVTDNRLKLRVLFLLALLVTVFTLPNRVLAKDVFYLKGKINLNRASEAELQKLPFVGTKKAKNIISYRSRKGYFKSSKDILKVDGVGEDTYLAIAGE